MCIWKESGVRVRVLMGMKRKGGSECEYCKVHNICKCIYNEYASVKRKYWNIEKQLIPVWKLTSTKSDNIFCNHSKHCPAIMCWLEKLLISNNYVIKSY